VSFPSPRPSTRQGETHSVAGFTQQYRNVGLMHRGLVNDQVKIL
jgi:hypothetical protein